MEFIYDSIIPGAVAIETGCDGWFLLCGSKGSSEDLPQAEPIHSAVQAPDPRLPSAIVDTYIFVLVEGLALHLISTDCSLKQNTYFSREGDTKYPIP